MSALDPFPVAALAAAALPSTGSGRATPPQRPDPADQLLQAVRGRDGQLASRLLQQWVHRRGMASLEPFRLRLAAAEGQAACDWLQHLIDLPLAAVPAASIGLEVSPAPAAPAAAQEPLPAEARIATELDQAVAAYWQETTAASLPDPDGQGGVSIGLAGRVLAAGRQSFSGLTTLVRDCLDEALGGLSTASSTAEPPAPGVVEPPAAAPTEPVSAAVSSQAAPRATPASAPAPRPWQVGPAVQRRSPAAGANRPAPAPAALSDLRAWLPDSGDQGSPAL